MCILQDKKILAIDDTAAIRRFLRISLMDQGVDFHEAATASEGVRLCQELAPDFVVLDLGLPDRDGLEIISELKKAGGKASPAIVVLTVRSERRYRETAFARGADAYITKPFEVDELVETLEQASV